MACDGAYLFLWVPRTSHLFFWLLSDFCWPLHTIPLVLCDSHAQNSACWPVLTRNLHWDSGEDSCCQRQPFTFLTAPSTSPLAPQHIKETPALLPSCTVLSHIYSCLHLHHSGLKTHLNWKNLWPSAVKKVYLAFFFLSFFCKDVSLLSLHTAPIRNRHSFSPWLALRSKTNGQSPKIWMKFSHILNHTLHYASLLHRQVWMWWRGTIPQTVKESSAVNTDWDAKMQTLHYRFRTSTPDVLCAGTWMHHQEKPIPCLSWWLEPPNHTVWAVLTLETSLSWVSWRNMGKTITQLSF